ncbi:unnamed protein product [Cuscuta epithymum]|uniref:Uncharacterized protein n=1 Tax=Cuscuta epithymum TaxID=186058 RepID=A0AAV0CLZ9_9ASTE|nr:unnamed protein product [Cuscuta epithymum]
MIPASTHVAAKKARKKFVTNSKKISSGTFRSSTTDTSYYSSCYPVSENQKRVRNYETSYSSCSSVSKSRRCAGISKTSSSSCFPFRKLGRVLEIQKLPRVHDFQFQKLVQNTPQLPTSVVSLLLKLRSVLETRRLSILAMEPFP